MGQFPDRIGYDYWINSHLSIARHYGAVVINGERYVIDPTDNALVKESTLPKPKRKRTTKASE